MFLQLGTLLDAFWCKSGISPLAVICGVVPALGVTYKYELWRHCCRCNNDDSEYFLWNSWVRKPIKDYLVLAVGERLRVADCKWRFVFILR